MDKLTCTAKEWANLVGCSLPLAYEMTHIEGFPVIRIGRKCIILTEQAKQWLADNAGKVLR